MRLIAATVLLALWACQPIPHPFADDHPGPRSPVLSPPDSVGIAVPPVSGAPAAMADVLAEAMAAALRDADVPASSHVRNHRSYWLVGTARERLLYGGASTIVVDWELRDPQGKVLGHQSADTEVASAGWASGDAEVAREAARPAALQIAKLVAGNAPAPVEVPRPVLAVRGITGAPGDGGSALAGAIAAALTQAHVELADGATSKPETCILTGRVDVSAPRDGRQEVAVVWQVARPDGSEIGKVTQENAVPAGSLDGQWGAIAHAVAAAAAPGIVALLDRSEPGKSDTLSP